MTEETRVTHITEPDVPAQTDCEDDKDCPPPPYFKDLLPKVLCELLSKELDAVKANEPQKLNLLLEDAKLKLGFLQGWGKPLSTNLLRYEDMEPIPIIPECNLNDPVEPCCDDIQRHEAECWLQNQQIKLETEKAALQKELADCQKLVDEHIAQNVTPKEQDINKYIKKASTFVDDLKAATELRDRLKEQRDEVERDDNGDPILDGNGNPIPVLSEDSNLWKQLNSQWEEAQNAITALGTPAELDEEISTLLEQWQAARDTLHCLVYGECPDDDNSGNNNTNSDEPPATLESIGIKIKKINKKLEFIQTYWDVLIAYYLAYEEGCTIKETKNGDMVFDKLLAQCTSA